MRAVIESMSKRTFELEFTGTATIELDDAVIDAVDDDWRAVFYQLHTPEEIARHVGYNLVINGEFTAKDDYGQVGKGCD